MYKLVERKNIYSGLWRVTIRMWSTLGRKLVYVFKNSEVCLKCHSGFLYFISIFWDLYGYVVESCFQGFLSMYQGKKFTNLLWNYIFSRVLFPEALITSTHELAEVVLLTVDGSFKCHKHSPCPMQYREHKIKFLMNLWCKDALRERTSLYHYLSLTPDISSCLVQISSAPPNPSCLSLSQRTGKCSYLNTGDTCRFQLSNAISSFLSRTFHSSGSGKEEKHRHGRHKSSLVILWVKALFPLGVVPSSISFPLLHWFCLALSSSKLAMKHLPPPDLSCHHTRIFIYNLGHVFYILDPMTGRVYYCLSPLNFHNYISVLWFLESVAYKSSFLLTEVIVICFILKKPVLPVINSN